MTVVKQILGHHVTFGGERHSGWLPQGAAMPKPTPTRDVALNITRGKAMLRTTTTIEPATVLTFYTSVMMRNQFSESLTIQEDGTILINTTN